MPSSSRGCSHFTTPAVTWQVYLFLEPCPSGNPSHARCDTWWAFFYFIFLFFWEFIFFWEKGGIFKSLKAWMRLIFLWVTFKSLRLGWVIFKSLKTWMSHFQVSQDLDESLSSVSRLGWVTFKSLKTWMKSGKKRNRTWMKSGKKMNLNPKFQCGFRWIVVTQTYLICWESRRVYAPIICPHLG